jgi:hypothetical protein
VRTSKPARVVKASALGARNFCWISNRVGKQGEGLRKHWKGRSRDVWGPLHRFDIDRGSSGRPNQNPDVHAIWVLFQVQMSGMVPLLFIAANHPRHLVFMQKLKRKGKGREKKIDSCFSYKKKKEKEKKIYLNIKKNVDGRARQSSG